MSPATWRENRIARSSKMTLSWRVMVMLVAGAWLPWWAAAKPSMQPGFKQTTPAAGSDLIITLLSNGLPTQGSGPLKVRILLHGEPAAGAYVWVENAAGRRPKAEVADREGVVTVQVRHPGFSTLRAVVPSSSADPNQPSTEAAAIGSLSIFLNPPTK